MPRSRSQPHHEASLGCSDPRGHPKSSESPSFPGPKGKSRPCRGHLQVGATAPAPPVLLQEGGDTVHKRIVTQSEGVGKHTFSCT